MKFKSLVYALPSPPVNNTSWFVAGLKMLQTVNTNIMVQWCIPPSLNASFLSDNFNAWINNILRLVYKGQIWVLFTILKMATIYNGPQLEKEKNKNYQTLIRKSRDISGG